MDFKQLQKLYNEIYSNKKYVKGTYSPHYEIFINDAFLMAEWIEDDKSFGLKKKGDENRRQNLAEFRKKFYDTMGKYLEVYKEGGNHSLQNPQTIHSILPDDPRIAKLANLQMNEMAELNRSLPLLKPYDERMQVVWDNQIEYTKRIGGNLSFAAKENFDAKMRKAAEESIARTYDAIEARENAFFKSLTAPQQDYVMKKTAVDPDGKVNAESSYNLSRMISVAAMLGRDESVEPESRLRLLTAVSKMQNFYYDNLVFEEQRFQFKDKALAQNFVNEVGAAFTEVETYLDQQNLSPEIRQATAGLRKDFHEAMDAVIDDVRLTVDAVRYNTWRDWKDHADRAQKELDSFQKQGKQELMKKHGLKTDEQFYFMMALELNPDYKKSPINDDMMALLGIEEEKLPEGLRAQAHDIKSKAYDSAMSTISQFLPEKDGNPHFLDLEEMNAIYTKYDELADALRDFSDNLKQAGIEDTKSVDTARDKMRRLRVTIWDATEYMRQHANASDLETIRPFSMYELHGIVNPDLGDKLPRKAEKLGEQLSDALEAIDAGKTKTSTKKLEKQKLQDIVAEVKDLTENVMPQMLKTSRDDSLFRPMTMEQVKEYSEIFARKEKLLAGYLGQMQVRKDSLDLSRPELELMDTLTEIHKSVRMKSRVLGYLGDNVQGTSLKEDIEQFNEDEDLRRRREAQTGEKQDPSYAKEEIHTLMYGMRCKELMNNGMMLAPFLFEDPQQQRGVELLSMKLAEKNIADVQKRQEDLAKVKWNDDGTRDLSQVPEYKGRRNQIGDYGHTIQYATKNDWDTFEKVVDATLKNMPASLKKLRIKVYKENSINTFEKKVNLEELIREKMKTARESGRTILDFMDTSENEKDGFNSIFYNYPAFAEIAVPSHEKRVNNFIWQLHENLKNAGLDNYAQQGLEDTHLPDGYNEGTAREQVNDLFGELDRTEKIDRLENQKIPLAESKAKQEQYMDVKVASVRGNVDPTAIEGQEFYTTTKYFRASDFVGATARDIKNKSELDEKLVGSAAQEMQDTILRSMFEPREQRKKKSEAAKPAEQSKNQRRGYKGDATLDSESPFATGKNLADMADLQVMDYLTGVPRRGTDDLRLGFKKENKTIALSSLTAANHSGNRPFQRLTPEEEKEKLTDPADMMVMTTEMYEKVSRWKRGLDGTDANALNEQEKKIFDSMDPEVKAGFKRRLDQLMKTTQDPKTTQYEDIRYNWNPANYSPDVKQGSIRVLDREKFESVKLYDLTVGKNEAAPKDKNGAPARNIFDTMADMPQKCSDAMADKIANEFTGGEFKEFARFDSNIGKSFYKEQKLDFDKNLNNMKAMDLCIRTTREMAGNAMEMDVRSKEKEYGWHSLWGDSKQYEDVMAGVEKLQEVVAKNLKLAADEQLLAKKGASSFSQERLTEIRQFQKERLEYTQNLAKRQGLPVPTELPAPDKDPNMFFKSLQEMQDLSSKMKEYMVKKKDPSTDMGKERMSSMMKMYNQLNRSIAEYATLSGDTTIMPSVVKSESDKKPFNPVFSDMYASVKEYDQTTPYYQKNAAKEEAAHEKTQKKLDKLSEKTRAQMEKEQKMQNEAAPKEKNSATISNEEYEKMKEDLEKNKNRTVKKTDAEKEMEKDVPKQEAPKRTLTFQKDGPGKDVLENNKAVQPQKH